MYETIPMPAEADFLASADPEVLAALRERPRHRVRSDRSL